MRAGVSCLFLLALIVAVLVLVPPRLAEDHYVHTGADPLLAARSINTVWNAYVPVPLYEDGRVVWNTNFLGIFNAWVSSNPEAPPAIPWAAPLSSREVIALLLSLALLLGAVRALAPDRTIMIVFSLTTLAMLFFSYSVFFGWMRQHGHLYLAFVACLWIARDNGPADREPRRQMRWFLPFLLIVQAAGGMALYAVDLVRPFTSSNEVASFLQRGGLAEYPLAGDPDFLLTPLSGLLDRPFWSLETGEATTSTVWKTARYPRDRDLLKRMRKALRTSGSNAVLLITSYSVEAAVGAGKERSPRIGIQLTYLAWFRPAMVPDEHYVVYYLQPAGRALPDKISELALQDPIEY